VSLTGNRYWSRTLVAMLRAEEQKRAPGIVGGVTLIVEGLVKQE
jgi:hypothetical protein